jgi:GT2 family glycosyltransferase
MFFLSKIAQTFVSIFLYIGFIGYLIFYILSRLKQRGSLNYLQNILFEVSIKKVIKDKIKNIYSEYISKYPKFILNKISFDRLDEQTLISIIIVNWNGLAHLPELIQSLKNQTFKNFEVIFVDNNSSDGSVKFISQHFPEARVIALNNNTGFAHANNVGLDHAKGTLIALLNNDTKVKNDWLQNLFYTIKNNKECVAVSPKILFWTKFQRIQISTNVPVQLELNRFLNTLTYKKYFIRSAINQTDEYIQISEKYPLVLDIPCQEEAINFIFLSDSIENLDINISSVAGSRNYKIISGEDCVFSFRAKDKKNAYHLINNAGSQEIEGFKPFDRGFGDIDDHRYNNKNSTNLICGCSALIRREALQGMPLFIDDFFTYYEDTELSRRLRKFGKIIYEPKAVVFHKHSATTKEKSTQWHYFVNRNKILYQYIYSHSKTREDFLIKEINILRTYKKDLIKKSPKNSELNKFGLLIPKLISDLKIISAKIRNNTIYTKSMPRIAIYNSYWNTFGGGEAHCLVFAEYLQKLGMVDLIGTEPFDIKKLEKYYDLYLPNVRRRVVNDLTTEDTKAYDIFINSTHSSRLISKAKLSFYIVSFPFKNPSKNFLKSYFFLPNSDYTTNWAKIYWNKFNFNYKRIYPAFDTSKKIRKSKPPSFNRKKKLILSVGRWCVDGHNKNQYELAKAFVNAKKMNSSLENWKIIFAGSLNESRQQDKRYFKKTATLINNYGGIALANVSHDQLTKLYEEASLYWHATGLHCDPKLQPELFEHFGMTVVEAASYGCMPMVFNGAGPAEILKSLDIGYKWNSIDDLVSQFNTYIELEKKSPRSLLNDRKLLIKRVNKFSSERLKFEFGEILKARIKTLGLSKVYDI